VHKMAVHADREHFHTQLFQLFGFGGNCRQLRRSNKCEISRIEAEYHPLP
jgi:hypothetical protein